MTEVAYPFVTAAERYVDDVLAGHIPACHWIKLACERHRLDVGRIPDADWPWRFDVDKAERAIRFMSRFPHVKGRQFIGKRFEPQPWQCFFYASVFGWVRKAWADCAHSKLDREQDWHAGMRRFRKVRLYVPRKNGKSLMMAPVALYMLAADGEPGAEVYTGATNEKQAWEVFGPARQMAIKQTGFKRHFGVAINARSVVIEGSMAKLEPIIGKPGDGSSPHCSITDEYHEHQTDDQLATMETGMGARLQPISFVVSTAGDNISGPCRDDWLDCEKVLERVTRNDQLFAMIFTVDADTDWTSEEALWMSNPNLGVSKDVEGLRAEQQQAINNPRKQGHFKIKHLNVWVQARDAFFNLESYRRTTEKDLSLADFEGRECIVAFDLASKIDLTAVLFIFPEADNKFAVFGKYYLPEATVDLPENEHYRAWRERGVLTVTPGNMTDYFQVLDDLVEAKHQFDLREVAYDPHNATMLVTALMEQNIPMVEFGPTVLNFSEPMKELDGRIRDGKVRHNDDPVLEWCLSNVVAKLDRKDNVFPNKTRNENKIDAAVALIMAVGRMLDGGEPVDDWSGFINDPVVA